MLTNEPFVIRSLSHDDLDWLLNLQKKIDVGFTSLPNNRDYLSKRVDTVVKSFTEQIPPPQRIYLFVRENIDTGQRVGISGIQACAGFNTLFYSYEITNVTQLSHSLNLHFDHRMLSLVEDFQDAAELISFWIDPESRGKAYGKSLSYTRFLFMAQFAELLGEQVIAEIRGVTDADGNTPFWEAIGRHFFNMDFATADYLTMSTDKQFIEDLMPRMPIYLDLLPKAAQDVIGMPHATAAPAKTLLEQQGLKFKKYIDIFDGGPLLSANLQDIHLVANSMLKKVKTINEIKEGPEALIATTKIDMRATAGKIIESDGGITISKQTAEILQVAEGDQIRYAKI